MCFTKAKGEFVAEMVLVHQNGKYLCDYAMAFINCRNIFITNRQE